ncbi:MAG: hypothetical protein HYW48_01235 [Deltaproteobacteria bacterium]|nr:hypothetical protein [Deltaproteobacteria bacterium]
MEETAQLVPPRNPLPQAADSLGLAIIFKELLKYKPIAAVIVNVGRVTNKRIRYDYKNFINLKSMFFCWSCAFDGV